MNIYELAMMFNLGGYGNTHFWMLTFIVQLAKIELLGFLQAWSQFCQ